MSWWVLSSVSCFPIDAPFWNRSSRQAKLKTLVILVSLVVISVLSTQALGKDARRLHWAWFWQDTGSWALSWMTEPLRIFSGVAPPLCCAPLGARTAAGFLMPCQERHAGEGLGAHSAPVLLGTSVSLQMGPQVGTVSKGPAAVRTGIGLLTCGRKKAGQGSGCRQDNPTDGG